MTEEQLNQIISATKSDKGKPFLSLLDERLLTGLLAVVGFLLYETYSKVENNNTIIAKLVTAQEARDKAIDKIEQENVAKNTVLDSTEKRVAKLENNYAHIAEKLESIADAVKK